jgi:hypothetical protein
MKRVDVEPGIKKPLGPVGLGALIFGICFAALLLLIVSTAIVNMLFGWLLATIWGIVLTVILVASIGMPIGLYMDENYR